MKIGKRSVRSEIVEEVWIRVKGEKPTYFPLESPIELHEGDMLEISLTANELFKGVDQDHAQFDHLRMSWP